VGLSVSLPANLELVSATPSTGTCSSLCGDSVVCEFGDLNSGATAAVALQLEGVIEGDATVSFGVGGNQIDPNLGDNIGGRTVTVSGDRELLTLDAYDGPGDVDLVNRSPDYTESYGSVPVVLPGEVVFAGHGLALDPTTGEFFAILSVDDNASTRMLVTIDPRSGLATSIGETGDRFSAVAIDEVGTVFGLTGNGASESETLYELNRSTAVPTLIGSLANGDRGEALAFNDNDGLLYHLGGPDFFESVQVPGPVRNSIPLCRPLPVYSPLAATQVSDDSLLVTSWDGLVRVDRDGTRQSVNTNNAYSKGMVIVEAAQADLGVSLVDSADPAIVGDTFTYTATISNDGPNSITDLGFVMALPGQVDGLSATPSQGTCSLDCGSVNCNLGDITSGGLATVAIEVRALLAGMAAAEVRYSAYADPDGSNNSDEETTTIDDPPLAETPPEIVSLDRNASIRRLSPTTLDTIETVPITLTGSSINNANGMAKNPLTGVYWALLSLSGQEGRELVTVNPISGEATSIGDTGDRFAALAFDETGVLYGLTGNGASSPLRLYTLDTMDASPTLVLDLSMDLESNQGVSLAYNPGDGLLYVASTNQLLAVDPLVPSSSSIALCRGFTWGVNGATALDDENLLLASDYGDLYRMQIATGTPVLLGDLDHTSKGLVLNDPTLIFADGFESGDTSAWSSTVP
jgi:uncharacterized repeat protein (TIGR01451 family)